MQTFPCTPTTAESGQRRFGGKVHYFGPWSDPQGALDEYLEQRDYLLAGRRAPENVTVANLLDDFLGEKLAHVETGDLAQVTFDEYEAVCEIINGHFGRAVAEHLTKEDFEGLRKRLAKGTRKATLSSVTLKR